MNMIDKTTIINELIGNYNSGSATDKNVAADGEFR